MIAEIYSGDFYDNTVNEFKSLKDEICSNSIDTITISKICVNKIKSGIFINKDKILKELQIK